MQPPQEPQSTPPKVFTPEELSSIPPELQKQLNLTSSVTPQEAEDGLSDIPPEVLAKIRAISGQNSAGIEPSGFSWAALLYGPVYYFAMKDWLFVVLSALASLVVVTVPALIPLAFLARKRAWKLKKWDSEEQFWQVQQSWDRSAIVGGVLSIIVLYFLSRYVFSVLSTTFGTTDSNVILQQVQDQYQ
jgi:hypothetical protein